MDIERYSDLSLAAQVLNDAAKKKDNERVKSRDKSDRATTEQVMDPRTRMMLFKMINRQLFAGVNGCISTGKEANVYHACRADGTERAVKVYKTSVLVFKDRDKYVTGEFRFQQGYCRHNPRKMVRTWAEKETRNLHRLYRAGVACPQPVHHKDHIVVMSFIGENGRAAPKLKDVSLDSSKARELYLQCIQTMRTMYHACHLIHADLSEFNLLYHQGQLYVIDVSQSVEYDHPNALEFLRKDCVNVNSYFRRRLGVAVMTGKELFDFITDLSISDDNIDDYLATLMKTVSERSRDDVSRLEAEEEVFMQAFIPRKLNDVVDFERDLERVREGIDTDLIMYPTVVGMKTDLSGVLTKPAIIDSTDSSEESDGESDSSDSESVETATSCNECLSNANETTAPGQPRPRAESPNSRKERKKAVKEAQRDKRKTKVPKYQKKRREKMAKTKKH